MSGFKSPTLADIDKIKAPDGAVCPVPTEKGQDELSPSDIEFAKQAELETKEMECAVELKRQRIKDVEQDRRERRGYAYRIFCLIVVWLWGLAMIVMMDGAMMLDISDKVLIGLITGTSVNVIGLMAIVAKYLFPKNNNGDK